MQTLFTSSQRDNHLIRYAYIFRKKNSLEIIKYIYKNKTLSKISNIHISVNHVVFGD